MSGQRLSKLITLTAILQDFGFPNPRTIDTLDTRKMFSQSLCSYHAFIISLVASNTLC